MTFIHIHGDWCKGGKVRGSFPTLLLYSGRTQYVRVNEYWKEIIVALITTGVVATVWKDVKRFIRWIAGKFHTKKFRDYLASGVAMDRSMNAMIEAGADRVLVIRCHNGGNNPKIGKRLFASLLAYEYNRQTYPEGPQDFQNLPLENTYIRMLLKLLEEKHLQIETANLDDPQLRIIYEYERVKFSEIFKLGAKGGSLYYVSVATTKDQPFSEEQMKIIRFHVDKLKNTLIKEINVKED